MRRLKPFALERLFARWEFVAPHLLSSSDCEPLSLEEVLALADGETAALWKTLRLGYTDSRGSPLLRREIAGLYEGFEEEDVLAVVPEEGILLALHAVLEPDDRVVCTWPGFQSLYEVARAAGAIVDRWEPVVENGVWRFRVPDLERVLEPRTKLVVVNFPHNPTGALPSASELRQCVELCRSRGARLFSDEMYRGLELDPAARLPAACELYDRAASLGGLSKAFGLAGLRLGWLATRDEAWRRRVGELKDYTTICGTAASEVLGLIVLRARAAILERQRARVAGNLGRLDAFFRRRPDAFSWPRPLAGSVGFARWLLPEDVGRFCERAAREAGVMALPSTVFGYEPAHIRFGFGREAFPQALERFEAALPPRAF